MAYSHSKLETYENCPLRYRLQYVDRVRSGRVSIEAFMGSTVHAALERLYRDLMMSRSPGVEDISRYYLDLWDAGWNDGVFVVRSEYGAEDYRETGLRCVRDYHRRYHPFEGGVPVWLEKKVRIPVPDGEGGWVDFTGVIDRLDILEGGRYEIHDYKTSSTLPTRQELEGERQLSLYQLAVEEAFPDAAGIELVWHYLFFDRELRLRRERGDLERIASQAASAVRELEAADDFPPRESALCAWCDLQEHCPRRKHPAMVSGLREPELSMERGIRLVDLYAEWRGRRKEAEERMGELREEILEYASCNQVDNIQGSSGVLRITRGLTPRLPRPGCAEREELERALRAGGAWDDAADLDARKLSALLEGGGISGELRSRIRSLVSWDETATLRLSGRR